jgi:hypothetical protein
MNEEIPCPNGIGFGLMVEALGVCLFLAVWFGYWAATP